MRVWLLAEMEEEESVPGMTTSALGAGAGEKEVVAALSCNEEDDVKSTRRVGDSDVDVEDPDPIAVGFDRALSPPPAASTVVDASSFVLLTAVPIDAVGGGVHARARAETGWYERGIVSAGLRVLGSNRSSLCDAKRIVRTVLYRDVLFF